MSDALRLVKVRELAASGEARRRRELHRLSLPEVGRAVGVSHVAVMNWELGRRRPSGKPALRYLDLLERLAP